MGRRWIGLVSCLLASATTLGAATEEEIETDLVELFSEASVEALPTSSQIHRRTVLSIGDISAELPVDALLDADNHYTLLHCKGSISGMRVDWLVACGYWERLQLAAEEIASGVANLFDHLVDLLPWNGTTVGLVTAQNGINSTFSDFIDFGNAVIHKLEEGTLFVGLYNPTGGLNADLERVFREFQGHDTPTIVRTRRFFTALVEELDAVNPSLVWTHIPHSEGALIAGRAIHGMAPEQQGLLRQHLYLYALNPVLPLPRDCGLFVTNVYSERDRLTSRLAQDYLGHPNYDIHIVPSLVQWREMDFYIADHNFLSRTLQSQLHHQVQHLRDHYGLHR